MLRKGLTRHNIISLKYAKLVITKKPTISFTNIIHFPRETIYNLRCFVAFCKILQLEHKSQILNKNWPEKVGFCQILNKKFSKIVL